MPDPQILADFQRKVHADLYGNILPFWIENALDEEHGGFLGGLTNDLEFRPEEAKSAIVCARILWTYATAFRITGERTYLDIADRASVYLEKHCWDREHGGLFWWLDRRGRPLVADKKIYGQVYGIYALVEYFRATQDARCLERAQEIFRLAEKHGADPQGEGYFDFFARDWSPLGPARLDSDGLDADKTMNTHLHILEAYTQLYRVWQPPQLQERLRALIDLFLDRILDPQTWHFHLFFDRQWRPISDYYSYGHDIEGSWLLCEAVDLLGDSALRPRVERAALNMARATLAEGMLEGGVIYEGDRQRVIDADRHWWPQAEAVVGFLNAFQLSGDETWFEAARVCWNFIEEKLIDRERGEWFHSISPEGEPYADQLKVSAWKGPYHNSRCCFEALERLEKIGAGARHL